MDSRAGVIDLGSNSIRLVVYDGFGRAPAPIFNERVICGLGSDIGRSGRLSPEGVQMALANLPRFASLASAMDVARLDVLATAATRDATDGEAFRAEVEARCGFSVKQLDGAAEARLSALGVVSGSPGATGLAADLGGGSLELVALRGGELGELTTMPLGPLRLIAHSGDPMEEVDRRLAAIPWLVDVPPDNLYVVGGAWRSLARVHMIRSGYPLRVVDHYELSPQETLKLCGVISGLGSKSLRRLQGVSRRRLDNLPMAAVVLSRLVDRIKPRRLVFSAMGLREGCLFDQLDRSMQKRDPLFASCSSFAARESRFPQLANATFDFLTPLFPKETPARARLRRAASILTDISWFEHPDYRAEQAFFRVLRLTLTGATHRERAALALAIYARYGGARNDQALRAVDTLLRKSDLTWAWTTGLGLRLATTLSGGQPELLRDAALKRQGDSVRLALSGTAAQLDGVSVQRRLAAVAEIAGVEAQLTLTA